MIYPRGTRPSIPCPQVTGDISIGDGPLRAGHGRLCRLLLAVAPAALAAVGRLCKGAGHGLPPLQVALPWLATPTRGVAMVGRPCRGWFTVLILYWFNHEKSALFAAMFSAPWSAIKPLSRLLFLLRQVGYRRGKRIILLRQHWPIVKPEKITTHRNSDQRDDPQEHGHTTSDLNNPRMKVDFPRWEEGDLIRWISCAKRYFRFYRTADATRVEISAIHLEGDAIQSKGATTVYSYSGDFLGAYLGRTIEPRGTKDKGHSLTSHAKAYCLLYHHPAPAPKKLIRDELRE
ncbi:hypothetical protein GW17_00026823 [Ensete ventricosum]|nr:hypothetical protein GW17_00026823 [Ensete ventricosum]